MCLEDGNWISFEPTVELKFSNFHSDNQLNEEGNLICTTKSRADIPLIVPVNRELSFTSEKNECVQYNDIFYCYDYWKAWKGTHKRVDDEDIANTAVKKISIPIGDNQNFYEVKPLCLYQNTQLQSPLDVNDFIRHRLDDIGRGTKQLRTFTSIVKKYRPVVMPQVRDIFNDCHAASATKYDADVDNNYGVFGWCTIPSKTMVNMEYNEGALYVPSSYDHHNRVGGSNFLQMDNDFKKVYQVWIQKNGYDPDEERVGHLDDNAKNTWAWLYNSRDWTYFAKPFFDVGRNNDVYSNQLDTYGYSEVGYPGTKNSLCPENSNHLNGVVFEKSAEGRSEDLTFLGIASSCRFLATRHHNENNLKVLSERYTGLLSYSQLKELTNKSDFNDVYGTQYTLPNEMSWSDVRLPFLDWVDDYDKTGSYVELTLGKYDPESQSTQLKYKYNLGQSHAIDDFDEDSVWFYITMVSPLEELDSVVELEDIMPYVFWWENRGTENNGPDVDCYGKASSAKLNYEQGGWCYSMAHEKQDEDVWMDTTRTPPVELKRPNMTIEHSWHAVSNTLGVDFSKKENGGALLTTDNSGNVYKGAFDPNCAGTDEKWKIHHLSNAFGANQHEDPTADKYYLGDHTHGDIDFKTRVSPETLNDTIMESIKDRPMTWNLWNVIRHYVYIKYFKNRHKALGDDASAWAELEKYTKKLVKGIYRTFQENKNTDQGPRSTFTDIDETATNYGGVCQIHWTNSFIEVSTILERNAREHQASFALFTGNVPKPTSDDITIARNEIQTEYGKYVDYGVVLDITDEMASARISYRAIQNSKDSFRVTTNEGVDADDGEDGMIPRVNEVRYTINGSRVSWGKNGRFKDTLVGNKFTAYGVEHTKSGNTITWDGGTSNIVDGKFTVQYDKWVPDPDKVSDFDHKVFQGFKYANLPSTFVIGDGVAYEQRQSDTAIDFSSVVDLDQMYPEAEYYLNDRLRKWVRKIRRAVINRQILPIYTSMEGMTKNVHKLTMADMKSITFQVVPSFYWKYEWSYNEFMIHRVGKLNSTSKNIVMYDMLGNVWEWVRDDWDEADNPISKLNGKVNPIVGKLDDTSTKKVIKGGAFDQLVRKVVSPVREGLERDKATSEYGTQDNVGFRPSLTFTAENEGGTFIPGETPVDLFFLFDASASQDNGIQEMLKQAKSIVKMFSGKVSLDASDEERSKQKDICHVGSALFMGNSIRLMCSAQCNKISQIGFIEHYTTQQVWYEGKHAPKGHVFYTSYSYPGAAKNSPWEWIPQPDTESTYGYCKRGPLIPERSNWMEIKPVSPYSFHSGTDVSGDPAGLLVKFNDYKDEVWMCGESDDNPSAKSIDEIESEQMPQKSVSFKSTKNAKDELVELTRTVESEQANTLKLGSMAKSSGMSLRGDTPSGGGGHSPSSPGGPDDSGKPPPTYHDHNVARRTFYKIEKSLYVHCGVPSWIEGDETGEEENETLHFGEIGDSEISNFDWYFNGDPNKSGAKNPFFNRAYDFFSYDTSWDGVSAFRWPFYYNPNVSEYRGVLTNMWAGCEPVCAIVSKLIKNGYFFSHPWNPGLGYLFRKKVPRLVFVFANECDNQFNMYYDYTKGWRICGVSVVPGADNNITFSANTEKTSKKDLNALDPYCVSQLGEEDILSQIHEYFD